MENNGSNITKKSHGDQIVWSSSRTDLLQTSSNSKSYACSFCKRGFSNAQALGGHMNIHRKDRARLRQAFDDEVLLSLDITSSTWNSVDHDHHRPQDSEDKSILMVEPREDHRRSEDIDRDSGKEIQKLPFLMDAKLESPEPGEEEKILFRSHGSPQNDMLDLELRLGPEPHDKPSKTRREFF